MSSVHWIEGTWKNIRTDRDEGETWKDIEGSLEGFAWRVLEGDTTITEKVTIFKQNDTLFYSVVAFGQNEDQRVNFKETYSSSNKMSFDNPEHDFPNFITYSVKGDSLNAQVGSYSDLNLQLFFNFVRVK